MMMGTKEPSLFLSKLIRRASVGRPATAAATRHFTERGSLMFD